jgi:hypothetical protein
MNRKALALTLMVSILVLTVVAVLIVEETNPSLFNNTDQNSLFIASFTPTTFGSKVTGGSIVFVNPTSNDFENLTLAVKIDDSELITPILRQLKPLPLGEPFSNYSVQITQTQITIEPNQNETVQLYLFDPDQNEPPLYETIVNVQTFSSHVFKFYLTQNNLGDIINGQSFTTPQEKAYLQITGYSSIEHSNNTWHEYFNSTTNRYEYINDQPNFYQQNHNFFPLDPSSYNWAKSRNQIGEHYFNITILNNNTVPVDKVEVDLGGGGAAYAFDKILQPNETYVIPVAVSGKNWWSVDSVNQMSTLSPTQTFASGDLISDQKQP